MSNNLSPMHYAGFFCRMSFDDSVFSYSANKRSVAVFFWNRFNKRIEIPINAIVELRIDNYLPYGRGLVMKIRSGYHYEKIKTLTPINITAVPDKVIEDLRLLVEKNNHEQPVAAFH